MECPICFEDKNDVFVCSVCKEIICTNCKEEWKKDCPFCRERYPEPSTTVPSRDIERPPVVILPTQPLLLDEIFVSERRWDTRQIGGFVFIGGLVAWYAFGN